MTEQVCLIMLLLSPAVIIPVHIGMSRIWREVTPQLVAARAVGFSIALVFVVAVAAAVQENETFGRVAPVLAYCLIVVSLIGYTYFHFFNMSETARRIRILYEIHSAGSLAPRQLEQLYRYTDITGARLKRLLALKQVKKEGDMYMLDGKLLFFVAVLVWRWRKIIALDDRTRDDGQ